MGTKLAPIIRYLDGLTGPDPLEHLRGLMEELEITRDDVAAYCKFDTRRYARNLVSKSKWYELLVLCWSPGQMSFIHDHAGSSCAFKIIHGTATEVVCDLTGKKADGRPTVWPIERRTYPVGGVCVSSSADIHRIGNESAGEDLITVHCYSPPLSMNTYEFDPEVLKDRPAQSLIAVPAR